MIWTITRKEIIHHITTARVLIFFIISTSLFIINGFTFVASYKSQLEVYSAQQTENWAKRNTTGIELIKKPNPLGFCVEGNSHIRPQTLSINLDGTIQSGLRNQYENFKLPDVRRIDWIFIIQTIYALFCVVLTFDAISGERTAGTLRLMASNSVSRAQILLGKYLAVLIIATAILLIGGLFSLLIINLYSINTPTKSDMMSLALFMILSVLYISLFICMSLLASSLTKNSSVALLSLLSIVVLLVFVVPNMSGIIAGKLVNALSDYESRAQSDAIGAEYIKSATEFQQHVQSGVIKDRDVIIKTNSDIYNRMDEARKKIMKEYDDGLTRKQGMAEVLSLISPSSAFQTSGESLVDTGSSYQKRFRKSAERYQEIYLNYVKSKVGEIITSWRPPGNIQLPDKTIINIPEVKPKSYNGDMSDFPVFTDPQPSIQERIQDGMFSIALLVLWNVFCILAAHIIFMRSSI